MGNLKIFCLILVFFLVLYGCSKEESPITPSGEQYSIIGEKISADLTLEKSPYRVTSTIVVDSSSTLNIEAGVRIYFEYSTQILVKGKISCIGNPSQQILFTSKNTSWKGIQIIGTGNQSILQFVIVENIDVTTLYNTTRDGAIEIINADVVITNSLFRNNKSNNGGALVIDQSESLILNNIFFNNYAVGYGGALLSSSSSNKIINNTFYKNVSYNYAGGLLLLSPILDSVQNNIFYENTCTTGDPRIAFFQTDSSHFVITYNFLQAGNNPYFVSTTDFHLSSMSPCINAGNPYLQYNDVDGTRNDQGAYGGPLGNW